MLDNKGGNSTSNNCIDLIKWFITNFPNHKIKNLYADREFPSNDFLQWLLDKNIPFIFRSKFRIIQTNSTTKIK